MDMEGDRMNLSSIKLKPLPADFKLRKVQDSALSLVRESFKKGNKRTIVHLATSGGKCLGHGTEILMYDGSIKQVQDVVVGDKLMGPDSSKRTVKSTCAGSEEMYEVAPIKGKSYMVNKSHILSLRLTSVNKRVTMPNGYKAVSGEVVNISIEDYIESSSTFKHLAKGWRAGVDFNNNHNLPIPPYVFGAWLGDGNSRKPQITSSDNEVIESWIKYAYDSECQIRKQDEKGNCDSYFIKTKRGQENPVLEKLKKLNVILNKHIPFEYKTSSQPERLSLLAGILDTDGYLTKGGYDIVFKQEKLASDVCFLVRSLGLAAYMNKCTKTIKSIGFSGEYYRISISGDCSIIPCKVERRKAPKRIKNKNVLNVGIKVEPIGVGKYYGFELSGVDRLFLLGDFTVTHNTILAGMIFRKAFEKNPNCQCWFIAPRITLLAQTKKEFETIFGYDCGIVQGNSKIDLSKHVQIATIQTLANRLKSDNHVIHTAFNGLPVAILASDESHLKFAGFEVVKDAWDCHMVGLSATPFTKGLGLFWQDVVRPSKMADLIKDGTIADYRVRACVAINRNNLGRTSTGEYKDSDVEDETVKIIGDVYKEWKDSEDAKGRPFLGFTTTIATCIALSELFNENGAKTAFVHSKMNDEDVQNTLDAFKAGFYEGIFSVVKLIEGFNFPEASMMIDCAPLAPSKDDPNVPNSAARYVQKLGRVIRKHDSKEYALVHDHANNFLQYGMIEEIENLYPKLDTSEKGEVIELTPEERAEKAVKECPACGMVMKGVHCDICGHVLKKPTQFLEAGDLEFKDGRMLEIKKTSKQKIARPDMTMEEKIHIARELKGHCFIKRQKSPSMNMSGYYAHKYKEITGTWPNDKRVKYDNVKMLKPSDGLLSWITSQNIRFAKRKKTA